MKQVRGTCREAGYQTDQTLHGQSGTPLYGGRLVRFTAAAAAVAGAAGPGKPVSESARFLLVCSMLLLQFDCYYYYYFPVS